MFKADLLSLNINGVALSQSTGTQNYSFLANIGYRYDLQQAWYVEPTAGLEYVQTNYSNQTALTSTTVALQDGDVFRGRIGAHLGVSWVDNNIRYEPTFTALAYDLFQVTTPTALLSGPTGLFLPNQLGKISGEVQAAVNFINLSNGWSGFARADFRFGENFVGGGGKLGVRYLW